MRDFEQNRATELCEQIQVINRRTLVHWATFVSTYSNRKSVMHPLKKDEFALINKMKFETKNVLEHLNRVADQSKNQSRRDGTTFNRTVSILQKLALLQREIDLEIERQI